MMFFPFHKWGNWSHSLEVSQLRPWQGWDLNPGLADFKRPHSVHISTQSPSPSLFPLIVNWKTAGWVASMLLMAHLRPSVGTRLWLWPHTCPALANRIHRLKETLQRSCCTNPVKTHFSCYKRFLLNSLLTSVLCFNAQKPTSFSFSAGLSPFAMESSLSYPELAKGKDYVLIPFWKIIYYGKMSAKKGKVSVMQDE